MTRKVAPHVAKAIQAVASHTGIVSTAGQCKNGPGPTPAAHVAAAIALGRAPAVQAKASATGPSPAAHVAAAIARGRAPAIQAKAPATQQARRPLAAHVPADRSVQGRSGSFAGHGPARLLQRSSPSPEPPENEAHQQFEKIRFLATQVGEKLGPAYREKGVTENRLTKVADALAEIMKNLAHQAAALEGKTSTFRTGGTGPFAGNREKAVGAFKRFLTKIWTEDGLQPPTKQQLGELFWDLKAMQNLSEANHRGAFLIVQVIASQFGMGNLSANILGKKIPFKKKFLKEVVGAFED